MSPNTDVLMENYTDEDMIFADVISYLTGGAHTTSFCELS